MKSMMLLTALLCVSPSVFAMDLKCHGRAEALEVEKSSEYASAPNYEVISKKNGWMVRHFNDTNTTASSYSNKKPFEQWTEDGITVVGVPGVLSIYIHDRYHAVLAEQRGGYDKIPKYTKYVELACE